MGAQAGLLRLGAVGGVVVVQPRFADAHHFGVFGQRDQIVIACHRLCRDAHRVGTGGVENRGVCLGDGAHGGFVLELGADGNHARHPCGLGAGDHVGQFTVEIGKVQVAVTVGDRVNVEGAVCHAWGPACSSCVG